MRDEPSGRRRSSLRRRITAVIALIVLAAVVGLGVAVHVLVLASQVSEARRVTGEQLGAASTVYERVGLLSLGARLDDPELPAELSAALTTAGARASYVSGSDTRQVWAAQRTTQGQIISLHVVLVPADGAVGAVDRALLLAGAVTVIAASVVGGVSAGRLSRRLRLAAGAAQDIAAGQRQVSLREAVGPGRDEVGDLADAVDAMADQLDRRLRSEQRFTADVAHDLRTPLTGLLTAASLLDDSRPAQLVRDRADALATLTEELLEVARLDAGTETAELEHVDLAAVVHRCVDRAIEHQELDAQDVSVAVERSEVILTDPRRLDRVLSNLLRNAVRHGAPPVPISVDARTIVIDDHGPGFSDALLSRGPERFRSSSDHRGAGHGLGLVIASGQARVLGGELIFANRPGGGARVTVELPGAASTRDQPDRIQTETRP